MNYKIYIYIYIKIYTYIFKCAYIKKKNKTYKDIPHKM